MDSFESVVGKLLEHDGFWVRNSVKVELTKGEKRRIGKSSTPRWEIDLVAIKPKTNELYIVECKSFLDSGGVNFSAFDGSNPGFANRFKLFTNRSLFTVVKNRLVYQLCKDGACLPKPQIKLVLVAGKIAEKSRKALGEHFKNKNDWELWNEDEIYRRLKELAKDSYDNTVASVVAKIIFRHEKKFDH